MSDIFLGRDDSPRFLCDESKDLCFDDLAVNGGGSISNGGGSDPVHFRVPVLTDETFSLMLDRECVYAPKEGYLLRLRSGELDLNFRREGFDWIRKAHAHYCFGPLSFCLSINYLDRFLSLYELPRGQAWAVQLVSVACLWIAVKMEETNVPQSVELQVGEPKFLFEGKTIERMELLVLSTLSWRMNALTPCSFLDYFLAKITDANPIPKKVIKNSIQLILCTFRGLHFLEFKPSEVAAAVAISIAAKETQSVNIDKAISLLLPSSSSIHVQKDRVVKCVELIKELSLMNKTGDGGGSYFPKSPNGVLEIGYFSNTTTTTTSGDDNITVGSCPNTSSHNNKRKKLVHIISGGDSSKS